MGICKFIETALFDIVDDEIEVDFSLVFEEYRDQIVISALNVLLDSVQMLGKVTSKQREGAKSKIESVTHSNIFLDRVIAELHVQVEVNELVSSVQLLFHSKPLVLVCKFFFGGRRTSRGVRIMSAREQKLIHWSREDIATLIQLKVVPESAIRILHWIRILRRKLVGMVDIQHFICDINEFGVSRALSLNDQLLPEPFRTWIRVAV